MSRHFEITRRAFLQASGALVVSVALPPRRAAAELPRNLARNASLDSWVRIESDGTVTIFSGKVELGQGIQTAMAQIAADELDVSLARIRMGNVDTAHSPNEGRTVGSNSIPDGGSALRVAAAEARRVLVENAARRLGAPSSELTVEDGRIHVGGRDASLTYWELLASGRFDAEASGAATPRSRTARRHVGRPEQRLDLPAKFFGEPAYVQDLRLPGMLHARVVRPDLAAARLVSVDTDAVSAMPGVVTLVRDGGFLAVVAEREEQAIRAAESLRGHATWERVRALPKPEEFPALLRALKADSQVVHERAGGGSPVRTLEAEFSRPYIAHASMGPSAAVALWDGELLTVWSHGQGMYPLRGALAGALHMPESQIRCIHMENAGCYGHNGADDAACDAAMIARAVPGRPIRLQWSRQDEFRREPYGSAMDLKVAAGLDADNRIVDWRYELWSGSHSNRPGGGEDAGHLLAAREQRRALPEPYPSDGEQPTGGADRNAVPLYAFANQRIIEHIAVEQPLRISALRSLGAFANVFAIESFMDELAAAAGADPIEFRLRHLDDPRAAEVIRAAWALAGKAAPLVGGGRTGRGLGFAQYKNLGAYVAVVADVAVDDRGQARVRRAFAAADVGEIVNPDGVRNQIEGGIIQAASWTLKEAVQFTDDGISSVDWASYPILRFDEVPELEVELIDRPELDFVGAGEAAQGPTAAAIGNAIARGTGARVRALPLTAARVNAALETDSA
jgi:CO/xanthine dehydrogenase Mo-binding subunit